MCIIIAHRGILMGGLRTRIVATYDYFKQAVIHRIQIKALYQRFLTDADVGASNDNVLVHNIITIRRDTKKNGLTDVTILDRNDWGMAVSRATHYRGRAFKVTR